MINIALNIVRTKILAILIGTEGMGLFGAYSSITGLIGSVAGMGINTSGVRQIAEAVGNQDENKISRTVYVLRRTSIALGLLGMLTLLLFCRPLSNATFGSPSYAAPLALLSITILFAEITAGQSALIQGFRRIRDLAALSIWGAVLGTIFSIPIIYIFREKGIAPFLVTASALSIASSWWYARKIKLIIVTQDVPLSVIWKEAKTLLGIGVVFMASGLMTSAVAYICRVMIINHMDLEAAGLYQAAFSLSSVYVGFVLSAMGADYYPRLTAMAANNSAVNLMVNEQAEASLLMAVPGILGTLTFAPFVIHLLYSAHFEPAVEILRWQILGILGRIIIWPIGIVLLAKKCAKTFFFTELFANILHLTLIWFGMKWFGLKGLGIAFFGLYLVYGILIIIVVYRLSGFRWTAANLRLIQITIFATAIVFLLSNGLICKPWGTICGAVLTITSAIYSARKIALRAGYTDLRDAWRKITSRIRGQRT